MLRIVIWKDVLEVISTEIWFNNQNTLIHIDSSGFLYVILAWYAMKKCMHKIENIPLQPSSIYSCPWQMSQSPSDRTACVFESSGMARGWQMPSPRAMKNLQMPHPRDWQGGQMPAVARGGGGPLGAGGIDWGIKLILSLKSHMNVPLS